MPEQLAACHDVQLLVELWPNLEGQWLTQMHLRPGTKLGSCVQYAESNACKGAYLVSAARRMP